MTLISLRDLGVATPRLLFQNLTLTVGPGDRVGLVAGNGGGKSTLLRCVAGQLEPDAGSVVLSRGARLAFVEQDIPPGLLGLPLGEALRRALPAAERGREGWRVGAALDEFETMMLRNRSLADPALLWADHPDYLRPFGSALSMTEAAETILHGVADRYMDYCQRWQRDRTPISVEDNLRLWALAQQAGGLARRGLRAWHRHGHRPPARIGGRVGRRGHHRRSPDLGQPL